MIRRASALLACVALGLATVVCAATPVPDERVAAYQDFRHAFDAADYTTALPLATRVVELTRNQFGGESRELVNPLTNLGTTYYRMRDFGMALDTYREALTILDNQGNAADEQLVRPLHGMGAALRGLKRDEEAITPFKRAVEIVRNREGLYSPAQLPLLKQLIACYSSAGQPQEAGREQQYALNVAESAYGKNDLRLLDALQDYALWNEAVGQYTAARLVYVRAVQIADDALGSTNLKAVPGLRGIARTYRLAFVNGESEEAAATATSTMQDSLNANLLSRATSAPSSDGERALRDALQRLSAAKEPQPRLRGEVLTDLGDWYLTAGVASRAMGAYREAWHAMGEKDAQESLGTPFAVVYRPPVIATSRKQADPDQYDEQEIRLQLTIAADGNVRGATVANPVAEHEAAERAVVAAAKRALWRPAFRDGEPVAASDVSFSEHVYIRKPAEKKPDDRKPAEKKAS